MIPSQDIINKLADAVIERIASDRCCNTENIRDALFREWSAAYVAAEAAKPKGGASSMVGATDAVTITALNAARFMEVLRQYNCPHNVFYAAQRLFAGGTPL